MPFGAGLVVALVVLPALLCSDVEDDVLAVVLGGLGFCVLSEAADEDDSVKHVFGSVSSGVSAVCGTCLPNGCAAPSPPEVTGVDLRKGTQTCYGGGVRTGTARSGFREGERAAEGRGCSWRGTLNADRKANRTGALPCSIGNSMLRVAEA